MSRFDYRLTDEEKQDGWTICKHCNVNPVNTYRACVQWSCKKCQKVICYGCKMFVGVGPWRIVLNGKEVDLCKDPINPEGVDQIEK